MTDPIVVRRLQARTGSAPIHVQGHCDVLVLGGYVAYLGVFMKNYSEEVIE